MSRRSRVLVFLISTPIAALLIVGGLLGAAKPLPQSGVPHLRVFEDVVSLIVKDYVEDVNVDKVFDGAMRGLSDGLDPSSAYLTPEEVRAIDAKQPPAVGDVGLVVSRQVYLRVVGVRDGSPAQRAGLQTGDFIRAINDTPARELSAVAGARLLRGAPGSTVSLLIIRSNPADPRKIDLVREAPRAAPPTARRLASGERYIRVPTFGPNTAAELRAAFQPSATATVIDLRGTADGTAEDAIAAARLFVKSGTLATLAARGATNVVTQAGDGDGAIAAPIVLLVSNGTANAAEIFAAALSANKRARLVGEPTAGLAGVQRLVRLPEGHGLWLTYARYLLPDGTPIHDRGLRPDVPVDIPTVGFDEKPPATDAALDRAAEDLRKPTAEPESAAAGTARGTSPSAPPGGQGVLPPRP